MDRKLRETAYLGVEIMNSKRQVKKKRTNSSLPFDVTSQVIFLPSEEAPAGYPPQKIAIMEKLQARGAHSVFLPPGSL